jgi:hypothetical protein
MKVKEKGIDSSTIQRGGSKAEGSGNKQDGAHPRVRKFNAFKEVEKIQASGGKLPEFIAGPTGGGEGKRKRGADDDGSSGKRAKQVRCGRIFYCISSR